MSCLLFRVKNGAKSAKEKQEFVLVNYMEDLKKEKKKEIKYREIWIKGGEEDEESWSSNDVMSCNVPQKDLCEVIQSK